MGDRVVREIACAQCSVNSVSGWCLGSCLLCAVRSKCATGVGQGHMHTAYGTPSPET